MKKLTVLVLVLMFLLGTSTVVMADYGYVNDSYGVLSDSQIRELEDSAEELFQTNGVDFVTVSTGYFAGNNANTYATDLFNQIGIGDANLNNGLLLFIAWDSGDVELITGKGMKSVISNQTALDLIDDYFIPNARTEPAQAVMDIHSAIVQKAYGYYQGPVDSDYGQTSTSNSSSGIMTIVRIVVILVIIFAILFVIMLMFRSIGHRRSYRRSSYGRRSSNPFGRGYGGMGGMPPMGGMPLGGKSINTSRGSSSGSGAGKSFSSPSRSSSRSSSSRSSSSRSSSSRSSGSRSSGGGRSSGSGGGRKF